MTDTYITWDDNDEESRARAFEETGDNLESYGGVKSNASHRSFLDIETNRSVRTGFNREDYDKFRGAERVPVKDKEAIRMCMKAYEKVGIIKNVIDLMGDFASQGITISHPNERIENFYRSWWKKVSGSERSERFFNTLYKCGVVIVRRREGRINTDLRREMSKASTTDVKLDKEKIRRGYLGCKYDFLNPLLVEIDGDYGALYLDELKYKLRVSKNVQTSMRLNFGDRLSQTMKSQEFVDLKSEEISVYHYKKDDWQLWARPMIYSILDDIMYLEKMKLADLSALDGAISNIRLWTVGDLEHKILPTKGTLDRIRNILASNNGGGTMDLIWGPELKFQESNSQVYKFLGSEKYQTVLSSIYAGLGVPPTLTGIAGQSGGFTNNFISLKTLIERLEYGRDLLRQFWNQELRRVQKSMGFAKPAVIQFANMNLSDDVAEKNLLIQLADRDIISQKTLHERMGGNSVIEGARLRKEEKDRSKNVLPPKASPYHNPQIDKQQDNEKERIELNQEGQKEQEKFKRVGRPEDGRPKNATDKEKRKKRVDDKPRSKPGKANLFLWVNSAQKAVAEIVTPGLLESYGKRNIRVLTKEETAELEDIKLGILSNITPLTHIDQNAVAAVLEKGAKVPSDIRDLISIFSREFYSDNGRNPTTDELRQIHCLAYVFLN